MLKKRNVWNWFLQTVMIAALLAGGSLFAQSDNARITGTVTDLSGASIPGATITVTNLGTNAVQKVTSGGNGDFTISALPIGNYKAMVAAAGFASQDQTLKLDVGQVQALNFKLSVGSQSTVVDVTDAAPVIDIATSDTSQVITGRELSDLPLNGRNFTQLALLQPGISHGQSNNSLPATTRGSSRLKRFDLLKLVVPRSPRTVFVNSPTAFFSMVLITTNPL